MTSLVEKRRELRLVLVAETFLGTVDRIAVLVSLLRCDSVNHRFVSGLLWDGPVADAELAQVLEIDGFPRVVWEALVPGNIIEIVGTHSNE